MQFRNMNISQRLYAGFGSILILLGLLWAVNFFAYWHQATVKRLSILTRDAEQNAFEANMHLSNYLLSGSGSELESMKRNADDAASKIDEAQRLTGDSELKSYLQNSSTLAKRWMNDFAMVVADKRKQVDAGNATVAELQIFYLNLDPE